MTIYPTIAAATAVADTLNAGELDGWTYEVIARGDGTAVVLAKDEDGYPAGHI